jgi:hypothetical protein
VCVLQLWQGALVKKSIFVSNVKFTGRAWEEREVEADDWNAGKRRPSWRMASQGHSEGGLFLCLPYPPSTEAWSTGSCSLCCAEGAMGREKLRRSWQVGWVGLQESIGEMVGTGILN